MGVVDPELRWDDPAWREPSDNAWQRGLRLQQAWWRQERLEVPAGPRVGGDRLVNSMLPTEVGLQPNLMTDGAESSARLAIASLKAERRPGLIDEQRLRRNLLSSQPLCFNLFGHFAGSPNALLPWVSDLVPNAVAVTALRLEWAPLDEVFGGSAFDCFVEYETHHGRGFIGIECKYAENLAKALTTPAAPKYARATGRGAWLADAAGALDQTGLRQFWFNQLLAQRVAARDEYDEGLGVIVACSADSSARQAAELVAEQLNNPGTLRFSSIEDVVGSITEDRNWGTAFIERYLDFGPIQHLLKPSDPRRR